jgi:hypothetical protein
MHNWIWNMYTKKVVAVLEMSFLLRRVSKNVIGFSVSLLSLFYYIRKTRFMIPCLCVFIPLLSITLESADGFSQNVIRTLFC